MFLRKIIKNFGLFILMSCITISTQNKVIAVKAASNDSEIVLNNKNTATIQPSQTYVIKLNPDGDSWKIDELEISIEEEYFENIMMNKKYYYKTIYVANTTKSKLVGGKGSDYHYLISIWLNGVNVTEKCSDKYDNNKHPNSPSADYIYRFLNDWNIVRADTFSVEIDSCKKPFSFDEGTVFKNLEVKIQKIKCNRIVTTSQEPTCTTDGAAKSTCEICGDYYSEPIKATGHTYVTKQTNYPTVYNAGTMDLYCTKCGDKSTTEIPQYEFNVSVGGSQLKAIKLGHKLLFANTHKDAKYIPFVVPHGESVFDIK